MFYEIKNYYYVQLPLFQTNVYFGIGDSECFESQVDVGKLFLE